MKGLCGYRVWVVDLDGVVWRGSEVIEENVHVLRLALEKGSRLVFLTNNSTKHRRVYAERLTGILGVEIGYRWVYTSGYAAVKWLKKSRGATRAYIVGEEGLLWEAVEAGHEPVGVDAVKQCSVEAVLVGLDRLASYDKLRWAHRAIKHCGAVFVATNRDPTLPLEGGLDDPGAGPLVAALESSTGREPDFVAGKPNPWILGLVLEETGARKSDILVVGDRVETDMELARRAGVWGVMVLTGAGSSPPSPEGFTVARDLEEFVSKCG